MFKRHVENMRFLFNSSTIIPEGAVSFVLMSSVSVLANFIRFNISSFNGIVYLIMHCLILLLIYYLATMSCFTLNISVTIWSKTTV